MGNRSSNGNGASAERLADHFVTYLFERKRDARHVRRVASWIGLLILGLERAAGSAWRIPRSRQLVVEVGGRHYKGRYSHTAGRRRGGTEIVEVLPGRGAPDGPTVATITSLKDAERFYHEAPDILSAAGR